MQGVENLLILSAILASDNVFMPDNAAIQPVTLEEEPLYPDVRVNQQAFIGAVIEMVPEEPSQSMPRQLVLANLPDLIMATVSENQLGLGLFVCDVLYMMHPLAVQYLPELLNGEIKGMDVACDVVSEILTEPRQLEMDFGLVMGSLNIAADVSIKQRLVAIQQRYKISFAQEEAAGFTVKDVKSGQGNKIRFRRGEFDENTITEIRHNALLSKLYFSIAQAEKSCIMNCLMTLEMVLPEGDKKSHDRLKSWLARKI